MTTLFIYEYITALGARDDAKSPLAPSLLREGRAMLDAVVADFQALPDVEVRTIAAEDESSFRDMARRAHFTFVIAPEFDGILESRCRWVEEEAGRLLGPSSAAIRLAADKLELFHHFKKHGVPTPRTWPLGREPNDISPVICKPRDGAGSQSIFRRRDSPDAACESPSPVEREKFIAQVYVEGFASSVSFLVGPRACIALQPCAQHLSMDGNFRYLGGSTPLPVKLAERAIELGRQAVLSVSGLLGYVGVDLVLGEDSAGDRVIEINPRLTTSYVGLRQLADFNIADLMLRIVRGEPLQEQRWHAGQVQFTSEGTALLNLS